MPKISRTRWARIVAQPNLLKVTYLLTYSMQQSPSGETNRFAVRQKFSAFNF
jgi:hypothetical protein